MYIVHVQFNNRQLNYWFLQDTVYKKKSSPGIGEGRIIKGSAMATFYRDGQLSTAYGNDQCHHAILNRAFWVMRFSSKWLVLMSLFAFTVHINAINRLFFLLLALFPLFVIVANLHFIIIYI